MELEPSTNFTPSVDHRPRIPEPLPVRLITVADATLLTRAGIKAELDAFYVGLFGFEAEADERDLETDATVLVYRAENFRLRFSVLDPPVRREDLRPLGIEVPSLPDAEQKLVEAEIEYERRRGVVPGTETIVLLDPAGNWIEIAESRRVG